MKLLVKFIFKDMDNFRSKLIIYRLRQRNFESHFNLPQHPSSASTNESTMILEHNGGGVSDVAMEQSCRPFHCSNHVVTPFMNVHFSVIHSRTLLENLLSVIVTHSSVSLTFTDTSARVWHLR